MIQKGFYSKLMKEVEEGQTSEQEGESSEENVSVFLETEQDDGIYCP